MNNNLIVIENGQINNYSLDDKISWEIGRPSKENYPDIKLYASTVSRKHGTFRNMDGIWFYLDGNGKNGTVYNRKKIKAGRNGNIKPIMMNDGDVFVFGTEEEAAQECKPVWALYTTRSFQERWRVADTKGMNRLTFKDGNHINKIEEPRKGMIIDGETGMAIYMGDITYLVGGISLTES